MENKVDYDEIEPVIYQYCNLTGLSVTDVTMDICDLLAEFSNLEGGEMFLELKNAVTNQFNCINKYPLFRVDVDGETLWNTYCSSFPIGSNPLFRVRAEHDCSACRSFIKTMGNVVAIVDGKLVSIWDTVLLRPYYYITVTNAMSALVHSHRISDVFLHPKPSAGIDKNYEILPDGSQQVWQHLYVTIPEKFVRNEKEIPTHLSVARDNHDVLFRSLSELTLNSVETALELISQNSIYRGEEFKDLLNEFLKIQKSFIKLNDHKKDLFVWSFIAENPLSALLRIRNTAIGTLLTDLSNEMDLEQAVRRFEVVMAPTNYKRPNPVITASMVKEAKNKLDELGLTTALDRRHAKLTDLTVNNILFVNRNVRPNPMEGRIFDELMVVTEKSFNRAEEVPIEKFFKELLPNLRSIEVLFETRHVPNLVSLIAPMDKDAGHLFKWPNNFSWSYNGEVTDSIRERVKAAGGNITGDVCCRLAWEGPDDLDFHMEEPGGYVIYYPKRRKLSPNGGMLDVDANGLDGIREHPVENIFYEKHGSMKEGTYKLIVHQFTKRSMNTEHDGFQIEVDVFGEICCFNYTKRLDAGKKIHVANIEVGKDGIKVSGQLPANDQISTVWGITSKTFHPVSVICYSPNHWDDHPPVGNKHYFFMIDKCVNETGARGFYNEFLKQELEKHRKVFEVLGSKMKVANAPATEQLSGLGFSSTTRDSLILRVTGGSTRVIKVLF